MGGFRVNIYDAMHVYICPYCAPCAKANLIETKLMGKTCDHKKTLFNKDKECKEDNYECKIVWQCRKCKEQFIGTEDFLKEQRRKIKDG